MTLVEDPTESLDWLMSAAAVRARAKEMLEAGVHAHLDHFMVETARLEAVADFVEKVVREAYPDLQVPYHSRWRHFDVAGRDRWALLSETLVDRDAVERARIRCELAITSVLLDAGAGDAWSYLEPDTGMRFGHSEGLAVASFDLYATGGFSSRADDPLRADSEVLRSFTSTKLNKAFQVTPDNPLVGPDGRVSLLRRLGHAIDSQPEVFGPKGRLGTLFDHLAEKAKDGAIPAETLLDVLLRALGSVWPGRIVRAGRNLGDVWPHSAVLHRNLNDPTDGLVPFHKLSQWLAYSLVEPLEEAGIRVVALDGLTGLPEYRNGGLMIDLGVLRPRDPAILAEPQPVGAEPVVEWRALTVALLDEVAPLVRARLGVSAATFPLARVLQGGTWAAGRRIARELRPDGGPPIRLDSDGTVF